MSGNNNQNHIPKVSVLIPTYNGGRFLHETISSVLCQTFTDFELLVCDDCSTDDSAAIAESLGDARIRVFRNETNLGNGQTRNKLISLARGEYCAMLDHDDICYDYRLEKQVDYLDNHPQAGVCSGIMEVIDEHGRLRCESMYSYLSDHEQVKVATLSKCAVANATLMFRREEFLTHGLFYENGPADDMSMYREAVHLLRFHNILTPLVKYRIWDGQVSSNQQDAQREHMMSSVIISHSKCGMELTADELAVLKKSICDELTPKDIPAFESYACRLLRCNSRSGVYDRKILKKALLGTHKKYGKKRVRFSESPGTYFRYFVFKLRAAFVCS